MEPKYIEKLVGKYCKIITKAPGQKKGKVQIGLLEDINYLENSIIIELKEEFDVVEVQDIVAIRPLA